MSTSRLRVTTRTISPVIGALILGLIAPCGWADIRVFVTAASQGAGLTHPENQFTPTLSTVEGGGNINARDFASGQFRCTQFPDPNTSEFAVLGVNAPAYIWLQFRNEPAGERIVGLEITIENNYGVQNVCYYLANNCNADGNKRWGGDATPPGYPEWTQNPQMMVAVGGTYGSGIVNEAVDPLPASNWNMYHKQAGSAGRATGVCLLGAVRFNVGLYNVRISNLGLASGGMPEITHCWVYCGGYPGELIACCMPDGSCQYVLPQNCQGAMHSFCQPFPCAVPGDLNCSGRLDFDDINPFVELLVDPLGYGNTYPACDWRYGDLNHDGVVDFADIDPFVALLAGEP